MKKFQYNRIKIILFLFAIMFFLYFSYIFLVDPERFESSIYKAPFLQILGLIGTPYLMICLIPYVLLLFRKNPALVIADDYMIDRSRFEAIGRIDFSEIRKIEKIRRRTLRITLKSEVSKYFANFDFFQKIIFRCTHFGFKKRHYYIYTFVFKDVTRDELYEQLNQALKRFKENKVKR